MEASDKESSDNISNSEDKLKAYSGLVFLGAGKNLSREALQFLERNFSLIYNGGDIYLRPIGQNDYLQPKSFQFARKNSVVEDKLLILNSEHITSEQESADQEMSLKTIRALNKHYDQGVGIKLGAEIEAIKHKYDSGDGILTPAYGIAGELILSPNWSIATGVRYGIRTYDIEGAEEFQGYPGIDYSLGNPMKVEVESRVIEIPLNLKYYYPISMDKEVFISLGYAPNLYLTQEFEYSHEATINNDQVVNINNTENIDQAKLYAGAIHASFGISWLLPNDRTLQTSVFYRNGLDEMGIEEREINMFGLNAAYLFKLR